MLKKLLFVVLLALAGVAQAAVFSLPWGPKPQFVDANGAPMSSGSLLTFAGGSSTPQVSYTDSTGGVANPTTITLNTRGETPNEVWLTGGQTYKFVLKDSAGVTVWTVDNVAGVNDITSALDEWKAGPAPSFVSTTSFTLAGDQTVEFHKGRRLKTTNSGGTVYSTIVSSVFGASTTVTVANDASVLDSGLSAVSYGIVRAVNPSISPDMVHRKGTAIVSATTTDIWSIVGDYVHVTGTTTITSLGTAPYAGAERTVIFDGALTLTYNATTLVLPGAASIITAAGDVAVVRADTTANMSVVKYQRASGKSLFDLAAIASGRNIGARTNSGTPNTKVDLTADEIILTDATLTSFKATSVSCTIDFGTTGAAGLDTGAQASSTWYYGWDIAKLDGTVSCLGSLSSTAPTLPSGYTFKALHTAARSDGSTHFLKYRQAGNWVYFEGNQQVLPGGAASAETTITISQAVPPNALAFSVNVYGSGAVGAGGAATSSILMRTVSGSTQLTTTFAGIANANFGFGNFGILPNISQTLLYLFTPTTNVSSVAINVDINSFKLPGGGE